MFPVHFSRFSLSLPGFMQFQNCHQGCALRKVHKIFHIKWHEHPQVTFFWTQLEAIVATDAKLGCEFRYRVCGNLI